MHLALTCQSGLESLVRNEAKKLGLENIRVHDRLILGEGDSSTYMILCMGSHFANRVYIVLAEERIVDFDTFFSEIKKIPWENFLPKNMPVVVDGASTRSALGSVSTIQSVTERAIRDRFSFPAQKYKEEEMHVLILILDDIVHVMLDITGDPLHMRGYRTKSGEAPIKESLASGIVALSGWKYRDPFWDPCCGSGTIAIEAVFLAKNRAPNLSRHFRFESLPGYDQKEHEMTQKFLKEKEFSGKYLIYASDIDPAILQIAEENARRAGVADEIRFFVSDAKKPFPYLPETPFLLTNPPYGKRLEQDDLGSLYRALDEKILTGKGGGYITSFFTDTSRKGWKNRKLLNGRDECRLWIRENEGK